MCGKFHVRPSDVALLIIAGLLALYGVRFEITTEHAPHATHTTYIVGVGK